MPQFNLKFHRIAFAAAALALSTAAWAAPPPVDAMDAAHVAVQAASNPVSDHYAPQELANAHQRLDSAEAAMAKRDYKQARVMAEEARADADLARAKSQALSARAQIDVRTQENADLQRRLLDVQPLAPGGLTPAMNMAPSAETPIQPSVPAFAPAQPVTGGFQPAPPASNAASTNPMQDNLSPIEPASNGSSGFTPAEPALSPTGQAQPYSDDAGPNPPVTGSEDTDRDPQPEPTQ